jgi:VanZ family protein
MSARWAAFLPAVVWAVTLFLLSSIPAQVLPRSQFRLADKLVHAAVYGVLGALAARGFHRGYRTTAWRAWVWGVLTAVLYGATDELHQVVVPGRSADVVDLLADGVGACVGAGLYVLRVRADPPTTR